jgi:hypothetical protein
MLDCDTAVIHPLLLPPGNDIKPSDNARSPVPDAVWACKAVCSSCWFWTREAGDAQHAGDHLQHGAVSGGTTPKMGGSSFPGHSRSHFLHDGTVQPSWDTGRRKTLTYRQPLDGCHGPALPDLTPDPILQITKCCQLCDPGCTAYF